MRATFPSHAAAVVPLWLRWPRRFDPLALVAGSTTPDPAYAWNGFRAGIPTHRAAGLPCSCLPVGLAGTVLVRWSLVRVAAHLPRLGPLELRDYGALGVMRPPWPVTLASVLTGAVSHVGWD